MKRREFLIAGGAGLGVLAAPLAALAQQRPMKVARIGFLGATSASGYATRADALRAGLRELGYVEGKNIAIEYLWADGKYERLPELAAELVRSKVDVIVTHGTPGTRAAKQATTAIPIVMGVSGDAVANGIVASLARPGGNVTGSTFFSPELSAKQLELLKNAVPRIAQVAVLVNPDNPSYVSEFQAVRIAATSLKLKLQQFDVRGPGEFEGDFSSIAKKRLDAVAIGQDGMLLANVRAIADLAARNRLPSTGTKEFAEAGGLIGYGVDFLQMFRRAATFVDKILKGAKPADLPIEQATRFETVLNLKTAKALGIKFPQSVLARADKVIE